MADIAASVLTRLKNKAQASGRSYQLCLQLFCQEEFLRRLEKSKYAENFVLKGGLFIYSLTEFDSRVTVDVDFLLRQMPNTPEQLRAVLEEIIAAPTENELSMMSKGYASIIIQNSAGTGKAVEYNKRILKHSTLLASIKMPIDLFVGKSSVQTNIYVFRVGEAHQKDDVVKFIDFSNDGYTRTNRKKASSNLRDTDRAKERYQEIVDLVRFGKGKLNILTEKEYYEGYIDPESGADWNQSAPIDTKPTLDDFKKTVSDYLAWEVSNILKNQNTEDERLGK